MKFIWTDENYESSTGVREIIYEREAKFGIAPCGIQLHQQRPTYCIIYLHELNNPTVRMHDVQDYLHSLMMATTNKQIRVEKE